MTSVYGAPSSGDRKHVWDTLRAFVWSPPGPHLFLGLQSNWVFHLEIGGNTIIQGWKQLSERKSDCNLIDIPFHGVPYSWTNNPKENPIIHERLDRGYCNDEWREIFCHVQITNYPIFLSDHAPILLNCTPEKIKKNRPYKIESWCLVYEAIEDLIKEAWNLNIHGSSLYVVHYKLEQAKAKCIKNGA